MWNLDTVLASKPVLPLARNDCTDGVISLDNIHNDVSVIVYRRVAVFVEFSNECFCEISRGIPQRCYIDYI